MRMSKKCVRILLVEDNGADAFMTREVLSESASHDYEITAVRNGVEALSLLKKDQGRQASTRFDLIVLDLSLPKMGGIEFLKELRKVSGRENIPVIVLTASPVPGAVEKVRELGVSDFLLKPLDLQEFESTLRNVIKV